MAAFGSFFAAGSRLRQGRSVCGLAVIAVMTEAS